MLTGDFALTWCRSYAPRLAASYTYTPEEGQNGAFRKLAGFIFGKNQASESVSMTEPAAAGKQTIDMTTPVSTEPADDDGRRVMRFYMPSTYTRETLPKPEEDDIVIEELPALTVAVVQYAYSGESYFEEHRDRLASWMAAEGIEATGKPLLQQYNPPWTLPWWKTNEVLIPCSYQQ